MLVLMGVTLHRHQDALGTMKVSPWAAAPEQCKTMMQLHPCSLYLQESGGFSETTHLGTALLGFATGWGRSLGHKKTQHPSVSEG